MTQLIESPFIHELFFIFFFENCDVHSRGRWQGERMCKEAMHAWYLVPPVAHRVDYFTLSVLAHGPSLHQKCEYEDDECDQSKYHRTHGDLPACVPQSSGNLASCVHIWGNLKLTRRAPPYIQLLHSWSEPVVVTVGSSLLVVRFACS